MQTLTVADRKAFKKIPNVPGLLSYRADNQQLYVSNESEWQSLAYEDEVIKFYVFCFLRSNVIINIKMLSFILFSEVRQLQQEVKSLETQLRTQGSSIKNLQKGNVGTYLYMCVN